MTSPALLAASHGTASHHGQRAVAALVRAVAQRLPDIGVEPAFVDVQEPDVPTSLRGIDGPVRVVPLLLSAGYHVYVDLTEAVTGRDDTALTGALGPDPRLVELLLRRLGEAGMRSDDAVVLAAAGSSDARAVVDCEAVAASLGERLGRAVPVGYLSAAQPTLVDAVAAARAGGRVVVATYLLAPGFFAERARGSGADVVSAPLLIADGEVPDELVDVVLDRYRG